MQTEFYTSQRMRNIENLLIKYMKSLSLKEARDFLDDYQRLIEDND